MLKDYFIKQSIKEVQIEEFIRKKFPLGDYSRTELRRTPLGVKILIYTNKPGRIIGRSGKNINEMTEALKQEFDLENPQLDVKTIPHPNLDAKIVAKQIASALEKGYNHKKIGNLTIKRIMESGAVGAQIKIAGKLGGSKGMVSKFIEGYIKHSGDPSKIMVDVGFEEAQTRPGKIGILVKIMREYLHITGEKSKEKLTYVKEATETEGQEDLKAEADAIEKKNMEAEKVKSEKAEKVDEKRIEKLEEAAKELKKKAAKPMGKKPEVQTKIKKDAEKPEKVKTKKTKEKKSNKSDVSKLDKEKGEKEEKKQF